MRHIFAKPRLFKKIAASSSKYLMLKPRIFYISKIAPGVHYNIRHSSLLPNDEHFAIQPESEASRKYSNEAMRYDETVTVIYRPSNDTKYRIIFRKS